MASQHLVSEKSISTHASSVGLGRIRFADSRPISLDFAQLPVERFPGLMEQRLGTSIYELLEREYGVAAADAEEQVEVVLATEEEAGLIGVETGAPLLAVSRVTYDAAGTPIEQSYDLFRADRTRIVMRTGGQGLAAVPAEGETIMELTNS